MKKLIEIISLFDTKESKLYWINALKISHTVKGKLIQYFEL